MTLAIEGCFLRIDSTGNILRNNTVHILPEFPGIGMGGERVQVCHHKITGVIFLELYIIAHGTKIISQVKEPCRADPTHNDCFLVAHGAKIMNGGRLKEGLRR